MYVLRGYLVYVYIEECTLVIIAVVAVLRHCLPSGSIYKSIMLHDNPQSVYQRAKRELLKTIRAGRTRRNVSFASKIPARYSRSW